MTTMTAKDAQNKFGQMLDAAQKEPVTITKYDRKIVVVVPAERYEELEAMEDAIWAARANQAGENGFMSNEESEAFLARILNA
jgi:prevent-host-death family protein